jgi:predicted restriction endonuclease
MKERNRTDWDQLLHSLQRSRDARARYFKPACLLALCSMIDRSKEAHSRFPAEAVIKEFEDLVRAVFPLNAKSGWMPLWHLSSDGAWTCLKGEVQTTRTAFAAGKPRTKRQLLSAVDTIELPYQLMQVWHHPDRRNELKEHLIYMLRTDKDHQANVAGDYFARWFGMAPSVQIREDAQNLLQDLSAIQGNTKISSTIRQQLIDARLGQGSYRRGLEKIFQDCCAVTGLKLGQLLRASHILAWKDSNDSERVDPNNGLLLSANLDALFDQHMITFDQIGRLRISRSIASTDLSLLGPLQDLRTKPTPEQWHYLQIHNAVFDRLDHLCP